MAERVATLETKVEQLRTGQIDISSSLDAKHNENRRSIHDIREILQANCDKDYEKERQRMIEQHARDLELAKAQATAQGAAMVRGSIFSVLTGFLTAVGAELVKRYLFH